MEMAECQVWISALRCNDNWSQELWLDRARGLHFMIIHDVRRLLRVPLQDDEAVVVCLDLLLGLVREDLDSFVIAILFGLGKSGPIGWLG